ncbi:DUF2207 family protein [Devosia aurantiaca]|uniref:DUF2207 domain-containing protein n=1 Tax=Devosia aurantiaca TaxID=2714858 RepID=A0A6M1SC33_9HYPH|nr:DUF2207 domain-containing protein [Devosia aurantiaca]NGP17479.1 DUF2207 domain-containing protein [Devosia aurantiaca]
MLAILALVGMVALDALDPVWLVAAVFGGIFVGVIGSVLFNVMKSGHVVQRIILIVFVGIFLFNFASAALAVLTTVTINTAAIAAGSIVVMTVIFAVLMRAPTVQGRKIMDEIEGFRLYLDTAEKNRLNINNEPPLTVERFERILPYAIALDVEKPWSDHFEAELARNAQPQGSYSPVWYSGRNGGWSNGGLSRGVAAASSGMAAAMVAAQPVQASSSGSSGGGFSGGGGGGGGGGGW